jgi:7-cyano-7-deazaguanine reductase
MSSGNYKKLSQLGQKVSIPSSPDRAILEKVPKPQVVYDYLVRFTCPEFTSLCPLTGQPDFAHIVIDYVPGKWLVESKSLKLYFQSFRNHGAFHEDCTVGIGDRLIKSLKPKWIRVSGYWYPRGGMPIDVFFQKGKLPADVFVPETGVKNYTGRG